MSREVIPTTLATWIKKNTLPELFGIVKCVFIKGHFVLDNFISTWETTEWARQTKQKAFYSLKVFFDKA